MVEVLGRIVSSSRLVTSVPYHANKPHRPSADTSGMDEEELAEILELLEERRRFITSPNGRGPAEGSKEKQREVTFG